ncbi:hypothetical protein PRIPAC_88964 [Pristionchus pacificus]|uniref:Uncharacterized protein n=1 Tax=Pristionchus pacificus TaxID=54126 RepID=A0A2A6B7Q7_PRIPA|nr:hypothetical protein PRIPAC_88964 [Pristionchus pacificus]|eukprot:PDM61906.1 hypothetical protein PRIPAC_51348 [Pristionchus pacificus]
MLLRSLLPLTAVVFSAHSAVISGETGSRRTELVKKVEPSPVNTNFEKDLEKLLETSGDLSLIEIRQKVDDLVASTDPETRKRHEAWKVAQHARDNERRERIKDAIMKLSKPAQAKLIRIIFVQEDEELTQNEKRSRLAEINKSLPELIREELVEKLRDTDVLSGFGFY